LCSKMSPDLVEHGNHIKDKHPYADGKVSTRSKPASEVITENSINTKMTVEEDLNRNKKNFAVRLNSEKEFQIIKELESNHFEASVHGVKYEVLRYVKEYRGADYYEELAEAELVWHNIFKNHNKYRYYFFDLEPGQRNILCKAYLFMISHQ
jgi:hypothetical protein